MTRVDFFAQLAAIERATGKRIGANRPVDEPVRFAPDVSLGFAARDAVPSEHDPRTWVTAFASLTGADSPLPPHLVEEIAREDPDRPVRRTLLTPFHHRATALLFRSVHRCRVPETTRSLDDAWPTRLALLVRPEAASDPFARELALLLAPMLYGAASAASLARALRVVSARWLGGAPIRLEERTGGRVPIEPSARARLGATRLGDTAVLGSTIADPSSVATIAIGPLDDRFTPALGDDGRARRALALAVAWLGDPATDVEVVVHRRDPRARVGVSRLGASTLGARQGRVRVRHVDLHATR